MLAFKHNAGCCGTPGTPGSDAETSGGPVSLHTAIGAKDRGLERLGPFLPLFTEVRGIGVLRSSYPPACIPLARPRSYPIDSAYPHMMNRSHLSSGYVHDLAALRMLTSYLRW